MWDSLLLPVVIWEVPDARPEFEPLLFQNALVTRVSAPVLPFAGPWPWYPRQLPHWGVSSCQETPRTWFAGEPKGQEWQSFRDTVLAVGRGRQVLQPLILDSVRRLTHAITIVVLTTPG
ncbi:MAG: hypothetical protein M0Z53_03895 [Thermaerobacter sp.]|nr:hypothetical protein [Thermaerobacter sp.]